MHLEVQHQDYAAFLQKKGFLPPLALIFSSFSPSEGYPWLAGWQRPLLLPSAAPLPWLPWALVAVVVLQPCMLRCYPLISLFSLSLVLSLPLIFICIFPFPAVWIPEIP